MRNTLSGFKQFLMRGNVIDLAVGVVIGAVFGQVVNALVRDIITPLIGLIGNVGDFSSFVINVGPSKLMIGDLINALISFLLSAIAIYFFVVLPVNVFMNRAKKNQTAPDPETKKCPECLSDIHKNAKRCSYCTSIVIP